MIKAQNLFSSLEIFKAQKFGMALFVVLLEALGILGGFDFWSHSLIRLVFIREWKVISQLHGFVAIK